MLSPSVAQLKHFGHIPRRRTCDNGYGCSEDTLALLLSVQSGTEIPRLIQSPAPRPKNVVLLNPAEAVTSETASLMGPEVAVGFGAADRPGVPTFSSLLLTCGRSDASDPTSLEAHPLIG